MILQHIPNFKVLFFFAFFLQKNEKNSQKLSFPWYHYSNVIIIKY
jgi:hypothetical protein